MEDEILEIVDKTGRSVGTASRSDVHKKRLLHKVVHLLVFDAKGDLILQKRSPDKEIEPGKWDTSVGGHVLSGEDVQTALIREMNEELGINDCETEFLYSYIHSGKAENELVFSYRCTYDGPVHFNDKEITEVRHWGLQDIINTLASNDFSEHFRDEFRHYRSWTGSTPT